MLDKIKGMLGIEPTPDLGNVIKGGAVILDVRTAREYAGGHVKGSINIPLDQLQNSISKLNKNKAIITCCASGMRSASAKGILKSAGFTNVYNGGSWLKVNGWINQ